MPTPLNSGTFVLDAHTGATCKADKAHLTAVLESKASSRASEETIRCLILVVGAKGARCLADLSDERVARVEWAHKAGNVVRAQVVERNGSGISSFDPSCMPSDSIHPGSHALVAFTDRHEALVYSLPMLEYLHTLPLPTASSV